MGIHGQCNSSKVRNVYTSKHKITKRRKKQQYKEKVKVKYLDIQPEDVDELTSGVQYRNKRWKTSASGVPISGKRRRKLIKSEKREIRQKNEEEQEKSAVKDVEMKEMTKRKKSESTATTEPPTPMELQQSN